MSLCPDGSHHTTPAFLPVPLKTLLEKTIKLCVLFRQQMVSLGILGFLWKYKANVRALSTRL